MPEKAIALPGMPSSYPETDSVSSPRNSFKPAIPDTPRTSTCTAASWAPAICLRITRVLQCPKSSPIPALPNLAARIDNRPIDFDKIENATQELARRYDTVLVEGAGGLMVPLTGEYLTIDYIADKNYPLIFVTSGKLGSINHTLLSLEAIGHRGITLDTVLYNLYPTVEDKTIQNDTMQYIREYLSRHFPGTKFEVVPEINNLYQTM